MALTAGRHSLVKDEANSGNSEIWKCPACSYRCLIVSWVPFQRIIMAHGAPGVEHYGSKITTETRDDIEFLASHGIVWGDDGAE